MEKLRDDSKEFQHDWIKLISVTVIYWCLVAAQCTWLYLNRKQSGVMEVLEVVGTISGIAVIAISVANKCYERYYSHPRWVRVYNKPKYLPNKIWRRFKDRKHVAKQMVYLNACGILAVIASITVNVYFGVVCGAVGWYCWDSWIKDPLHWGYTSDE